MELSQALGFMPTMDLSKYRGVLLLHNRVSKDTFDNVLDKVSKRLANWKAHTLLLAGRHTLIASVTTAIPNYTMQTMVLTPSLCASLERENVISYRVQWRIRRGCTWWLGIKCTLVKHEGDSAYGTLKSKTKFFSMKLGWSLVKRRDALWVQVIRNNYNCGDDLLLDIDKRRLRSNV